MICEGLFTVYSNYFLLTLLKPKGWYLGERCSKIFAKPWAVILIPCYDLTGGAVVGRLTLTSISNSSLTSQCNGAELPNANFLDAFPLILFLRLLVPISSNLMMHVCGFQRSRIQEPSFGRTFCIYLFIYLHVFVEVRIQLLQKMFRWIIIKNLGNIFWK